MSNILKNLEVFTSILLIFSLFFIFVLTYWNGWPFDLSSVYYAGWFYGTSEYELIYTGVPYDVNSTSALEAGRPSTVGYKIPPFLYPPLWAATLSPIAHNILPQSFFNSGLIFNSAVYCGSIALAWSLIGKGSTNFPVFISAAFVLSLLSPAVLLGLALGQPQVFTTFLILGAFVLAHRPWIAGSLIGLAAALKITPILFVIIFLACGRTRAGLIAVGVSILFAVISLTLTGWPLHKEFLEVGKNISRMIDIQNASASLTSLVAYIADLPALRVADTPAGIIRTVEKPLWLSTGATLAWMIGAAVLIIQSRGHPEALTLRLAGFSTLIPLFSAVSWAHYLILPLLVGLALAASVSNRVVILYAAVSVLILRHWPLDVFGPDLQDVSGTIRHVFWLCLFLAFVLAMARRKPIDTNEPKG